MRKVKYLGWYLVCQALYGLAFPFLLIGEYLRVAADWCADNALRLDDELVETMAGL